MIPIISVSTVIETVLVTAGLNPEAGHAAWIVFNPRLLRYMLIVPVPVLVVADVVPYKVLPPVSAKATVQLPKNAVLSSPLSVAVIVKRKYAEGVTLEVAKVIV